VSQAIASSGSLRIRRWWLVFSAVAFTWLVFGSRYLYFPLYVLHQVAPRLDSLLLPASDA